MENNIQKEDLLALVKSKIYTIRGQKVMLDFDLALTLTWQQCMGWKQECLISL